MKHLRKTGLCLLLALVMLLTAACVTGTAAADGTEAVGGGTGASETFHMYASDYGFMQLEASQGTSYVADYDAYGNISGFKAEQNYGFFLVRVSRTGYERIYVWAPSATQNLGDVEVSTIITVLFPSAGDYTVTVTPLTQTEINNNYWPRNRFVCWTVDAGWTLVRQSNCSAGTSVQPASQASGSLVTVNCFDTSGNFIRSYSETLSSSRAVVPQEISGYTATTAGQYVIFQNGMCYPASVTFYYQRNPASASLTVYCYDLSGRFIRSYSETVSGSRTVVPQEIGGYTSTGSGQYVTFRNGACSPSEITFYYIRNAASGQVTVTCRDSFGNVIRTYTETVSGSRKIAPQAISGYRSLSAAVTVTCTDGVCTPANVGFIYELNTVPPGPGSNPGAVTPARWDTQFKPGTATASNGSNADRVRKLPNLYDENPDTSFFWLVWKSEWKDEVPEITAYFNGDTVSSIGIVNGNAKDAARFAKYARATCYTARVYSTDGTLLSQTSIDLPDSFTRDYRVYSLGGTFGNVDRVELYLVSYKVGNTEQNVIHISEMQFYR